MIRLGSVPILRRLVASSQKKFVLSCPKLPEASTNRTEPGVPPATGPPIVPPGGFVMSKVPEKTLKV